MNAKDFKKNDLANITIGRLFELVTLYSQKYSSAKQDFFVDMLAELFEYEIDIPIDYLQMFSGLIYEND